MLWAFHGSLSWWRSMAQSPKPKPKKSQSTASAQAASEFLVCGLGGLGQYCVAELKEFGVSVSGIDRVQPSYWQIERVPRMLDNFWVGDCRHRDVLEKANIKRYRAVLLVTSDERVNIDAAFAVRLLNPHARLVVRSSKETLNELLEERLGNFVAFEATQLPTTAFAIAALGDENRGFIDLDNHLLRVVQRRVAPTDAWCNRRLLHELNTQTRRLLSHTRHSEMPDQEFYEWEPDDPVLAGDVLTWLELGDRLSKSSVPWGGGGDPRTPTARSASGVAPSPKRPWTRILSLPFWREKLDTFWEATAQQQSKRVATVMGLFVLVLLVVGMGILLASGRVDGPLEAAYATLMLLLGSYDALLDLQSRDPVPHWLQAMHLTYTLAGTASIAVLYALLTESLLSTKFQLPQRRPPLMKQGHIVVVGLGRVGRGVAAFLQKLNQPVVGISEDMLESSVLPHMPLVVGDLTSSLSRVNLETARGIVICTNDEITNLELAMKAHTLSPNSNVVVRTYDPAFSENVDRLLPYAHVLCAYALAAEVYVAASFGENVATLLRLDDRTIIATEYRIEPGDTLNGLLLSEIAYGYGVVPMLHEKAGDRHGSILPTDDRLVGVGDRLTVLATSAALQRIERGDRTPQTCYVRIEKATTSTARFEGSRAIIRITNLDGDRATQLLENLPAVLPKPLYKHQAKRLIRALSKCLVTASIDLSRK